MADLDETGERAQVLLTTALVLGVMFVTLALVLNSAIFAENLASRGETTSGNDAVQYHSDLRRGVGTLLVAENRNVSSGDGHVDVARRVDAGVDDADAMFTRRHAKRGALSNVTQTNRRDGARIYQTNASRNFTSGDAREDWVVVEDVERTRAFRLNLSGVSSSCSFPADCFAVTVRNASGHSWEVAVHDTGSQVEIRVRNVTGATATCAASGSAATVDLTAGTLAGADCPALSFADVPTGTYEIEFDDADAVEGTYSMVVDNETVANAPPTHFAPDADPTVRPALYSVTLDYEYRTDDVDVDTELRVAPGESDA